MTKVLLGCVLLLLGFAGVSAQTASAYKITNIRVVPYEQSSGTFEAEPAPNADPGYLNELSKSLFVAVEISGKAGSFAADRKVSITVTEGKRPKASRTEAVGLIGDAGKYYIPILLTSPMCGPVVITARLTGQKTVSVKTRKLQFDCGE